MKYEYDQIADGLYIWFVSDIDSQKEIYEGEIWPIEFKNEIGLIFAKDGKLLGMEIQPASKYFAEEVLRKNVVQ